MNFAHEVKDRGGCTYTGVSAYFCELEVKILDLKGFAVFCQFVQFTEVTM